MPLDKKLLEACSTEAMVSEILGMLKKNALLIGTDQYVPHHEVIYTYLCTQISALCTLYANLFDQLEQVHLAAVEAHSKLGEYSSERDTAIVSLLERVSALEAKNAQH